MSEVGWLRSDVQNNRCQMSEVGSPKQQMSDVPLLETYALRFRNELGLVYIAPSIDPTALFSSVNRL